MEYWKIRKLLNNITTQPPKLRTGLKYTMIGMENIALMMQSDFKLQCYSHVYVDTVMHTYSLK